jgi:hypothetical protein
MTTPKQRVLNALGKFVEMHPAGHFCYRGEHCSYWQKVLKAHARLARGRK